MHASHGAHACGSISSLDTLAQVPIVMQSLKALGLHHSQVHASQIQALARAIAIVFLSPCLQQLRLAYRPRDAVDAKRRPASFITTR